MSGVSNRLQALLGRQHAVIRHTANRRRFLVRTGVVVVVAGVLSGCGGGWSDGVIDDIEDADTCTELLAVNEANQFDEPPTSEKNIPANEIAEASTAYDSRADELGCDDLERDRFGDLKD